MGHGSYTSADWMKLKESSGITVDSSAQELFKKRTMDPKFDPKYFDKREARDSEDHPNSTPILIGLDTTGSMGYLAAQIAKESLHETMMKLFSTKPVEDPQLLFAAIGDVRDKAPLQVTQFESDIRIAEQLMDLWLEGAGGDSPEDFELLWYFAANHVSADCFEKHDRKGFLFTIGDADCHERLTADFIQEIFSDQHPTVSSEDLAWKASEKFELFHINISRNGNGNLPVLSRILKEHVLTIGREEIAAIPELIISAMLLTNGKDKNEVLALWREDIRPVVKKSISDLVVKQKRGFFF